MADQNYNGGKTGYWLSFAIREGVPALIGLITVLSTVFKVGKVKGLQSSTTPTGFDPEQANNLQK
jgi:hypothetical protein